MNPVTDGRERTVFAFGPFRLDARARTLQRDGVLVPLLPKAFDALVVLARNSGRLLDKDFLMSAIWPDAHVEENNLARAISDIRKALGEGPKDQQYVVTVARHGYRFAAVVEPLDQPAAVAPETVAPVTASGGRRLWWLAGGAATVVALALLAAWRAVPVPAPSPALGATDVLLLADVTNQTGDPVFDGTLREALAIQLERSPYLKVMDDAQVRQSLRLMGRPPGQRVTSEIGREVCIRERQKAMIEGSIAALGPSYVILLRATACADGATLAREQREVGDKAQVLAALGNAAATMRATLGESLASIEASERHQITQVTTPSLDAFQAFARGADLFRRGQWLDAVPFFEHATEIDPAFAMAFHQLGTAYDNAGERDRAIANARQAYALIDRVSERERLAIAVTYHMRVTGDTARAGDALRLFVDTYPRAAIPHAWRGDFYTSVGEFEKAAGDFEELVRLDPRSRIGYLNLAWAYTTLGRFDRVTTAAAAVSGLGLDMPEIHRILLTVALMQDVRPDAEREMRWFAGRDDEYLSLGAQAQHAVVTGRRGAAAALLHRGAELADRRHLAGLAMRWREAARADPYGDCQDDTSATLRACADFAADLRTLEARLVERPTDTLLAAVRVPVRRARLELRRQQPARAIALLQSATPYERRYVEVPYVRGLARLQTREYAEALAEFQKIVGQRAASWGARYPMALLGAARAAHGVGDLAAARAHYAALLTLWKDADAGLPLLVEARREAAALDVR